MLILLQSVTSCIRPRRMSSLRITITAGTVLPFAVWYGRGERGVVGRRYGALVYFCFLSVQRVSPSLPLPTTPLSPPPTTLQMTLLVLLSSDSLLLVLSTLATTATLQARCALRGPTAATGLVRHSPVRMHTACTSIAPLSSLRIASIVATVSLFAASGGERGYYYDMGARAFYYMDLTNLKF